MKLSIKEQARRNMAIFGSFASGATVWEIANKHDLTTASVYQIVRERARSLWLSHERADSYKKIVREQQEEIASLRLALESKKRQEDLETSSLEDLNISVLDLPERPDNCLKNLGVYSLRRLLTFSREELLKTPNMGLKSVCHIEWALSDLGLNLKQKAVELTQEEICNYHRTKEKL